MPTDTHWSKHLLRSLIHVSRRDVPWQVALRNTAGVVAPLLVGLSCGHLGAGVGIAVGALVVMFADQPGAYRDRLRRMVLTSAAGGLSALVGYSLGGHPQWMLLATAAWAFCASMLVALGPSATRAGLTSVILLLITGAGTGTQGASAWTAAALIASGGVLQSLLAVMAWPLQRYRPERLALSAAFLGLAAAARRAPTSDALPPISDAINALLTLLHGNDHARGRAPEAFLVLAAELERMRFELVALEDLQLALNPHDTQRVRELTAAAATVIEQLASALQQAQPAQAAARQLSAYDQVLDTLQRRAEQADSAANPLSIIVARGHALGAQLRAAIRNADYAGSHGEIRATTAERRMPRVLRQRQPWEVLRANLNLHSITLRHALRSTACITLALALSRLGGSEHAYWMPMTVAIVLKPDFGATVNYGLLRVLGTLAGLLLTTVLLQSLLDTTTSRIVLLAVCCFVYRQVAPMHYGLGVTMLTGMVVILLAFAGEPAAQVMWARGEFTLAGCALALLVYALWPTWERGRVRDTLATLFDCYQRYLLSLMTDEPGERANARAAARTARSNALASLERLQREPAPARQLLGSAQALLANSSRLARIAMTLEAILDDSDAVPGADALRDCLASASELVAAMAASIRHAHTAPDAAKLHLSARALHAALQAVSASDPHYGAAMALTHVADRLDDTLATLAFILAAPAQEERRKTITLSE